MPVRGSAVAGAGAGAGWAGALDDGCEGVTGGFELRPGSPGVVCVWRAVRLGRLALED